MPAVNKQQIVEEIASNISANYGIDEAIVNDFKTMMMNAMSQYYIYDQQQTEGKSKATKGKSSGSDAPKKPRKTSAYNVYVKTMMKSDDVKEVPQKEKMTKIGAMWKALTDEQRAAYKVEADAENAANPT
ncbi:MAG: hypothetical protein WD512_19090, partial [Candidatus Paceibacterota bacterium]